MNPWSPLAEHERLNVFVCYRRKEEEFAVALIRLALSPHFQLFVDTDGIPLGTEWQKVLTAEVAKCDVLLAIITPTWLRLQTDEGRRRLDADDDFVRFEIETALERGIQVIPVLLAGAQLPGKHQLPPTIQALGNRQAVEIRSSGIDVDRDIDRLVRALERTQADLESVRSEHRQISDAIERGDWMLLRRMPAAADVSAEIVGTLPYQLLVALRAQAAELGVAAEAIEKLDFKSARGALTRVAEHAPLIVQTAREVTEFGVRLSDTPTSETAMIRAIEKELEDAVARCPRQEGKVPGEREVRETLQRLVKDADYQDALQWYAGAEFDRAAKAFEMLADYKGARDRLARCTAWTKTLTALRHRDWVGAGQELTPLLTKSDEVRATDIKRWSAFARRMAPLLERMAACEWVPEERTLGGEGVSPYLVLKVPASTTVQHVYDLSYDLQSRLGGMTLDQRTAYDALRLTNKRLVVDFSLYAVGDPQRASKILERQFAFAPTDSVADVLARIQRDVEQPPDTTRSATTRNVFDPTLPIVKALEEDGGILYALTRNYDAAIETFLERARTAPWDAVALHHLGLAAYAKARRDPDAHAVSDAWEWVGMAWGSVFANAHFWDTWWAHRRRVYVEVDQEQITAARVQLQRSCSDELKTAADHDPGVAEIFRLELSAARAVGALRGIPCGPGGAHRAIAGARAVAALRLDQQLATWLRTFPLEAVDRDSDHRRVCIAFSSLAPAQLLIDEGRFGEAVTLLMQTREENGEAFTLANPGFTHIAKGRGRDLFVTVRRGLLQQAHLKLALSSVSEVPVNIDAAIRHWKEALEASQSLNNEPAIRDEIRAVIVGRCHVLQEQGREGHSKLDALNDAVRLVQDAIDQEWDNAEGQLRQALVNALLERAIHLSNRYDMEKEARQDAMRAWAYAPESLHAILVLCTASLHYARELYLKGKPHLTEALIREVKERLAEAERLFPGNGDVMRVVQGSKEIEAMLAGDSSGLEQALAALRSLAGETKGESADTRLQQAMVLEAQGEFARAVDLLWQLAQENPGGESVGRLSWCYRLWLRKLREEGDVITYTRVSGEAQQRCPGTAALGDLFDLAGEGA
jgi:tetratricopeptide (TPR) repeat protein